MTLPPRTFAELFCERYRLPPEGYVPEMLRRTFYPQARVLAPVIGFFAPEFFNADRDFVRGVGLMKRAEDLGGEVTEFHLHPRNRGFLRRFLKIRVSCRRVTHIVGDVMNRGGSGSSGAPSAPTRK